MMAFMMMDLLTYALDVFINVLLASLQTLIASLVELIEMQPLLASVILTSMMMERVVPA